MIRQLCQNTTVSFFHHERHVRPAFAPLVVLLVVPAFIVQFIASVIMFVLMLPAIALGFICAAPNRGGWRVRR